MHEGPSRIGHLFELVRSGTQHHLLGCSSGLIAVAPRNEGRLDSRNSGPGETSPGEQPESFPKWLLRHRHVSRGGLPAARLLQSGEALRPPPNPLPQPSKRFARREGFPGSQGESQGRLPTSCQASQKTVPDEGQAADCFTACSGRSAPYAGPPRHPGSGRFSFGLTHGLTLLPPLAMMDPTPPHTVAPLSHLPQPQLSTIP